MPISNDMIVRIASADIAMHMAFPGSIDHWHETNEVRPWKVLPENCGPLLLGTASAVVIDGNCWSPVSAPDGGIVHIYGDLASEVRIAGHYEIVITGDVLPEAKIDASGFCHLFVGGEFSGRLRADGSSKIWIGSNFRGAIETGNPSTELHIGGIFSGDVLPAETAALLWLTVGGFASTSALTKIVNHRYTQFNASIASSDADPGLHPANGHVKTSAGNNSFNRWCVQSKGRA